MSNPKQPTERTQQLKNALNALLNSPISAELTSADDEAAIALHGTLRRIATTTERPSYTRLNFAIGTHSIEIQTGTLTDVALQHRKDKPQRLLGIHLRFQDGYALHLKAPQPQ